MTTVVDASVVYLALAQRLDAPLITADQRFLDRVGPQALVVSLTDAT